MNNENSQDVRGRLEYAIDALAGFQGKLPAELEALLWMAPPPKHRAHVSVERGGGAACTGISISYEPEKSAGDSQAGRVEFDPLPIDGGPLSATVMNNRR